MNKLKIQFVSDNTPYDEVMSNALLTQLMVTIASVGLRTNKLNENNGTIIEENKHDNYKK